MPVVLLVVLVSAGAAAEPRGTAMPFVPEIVTAMIKSPRWKREGNKSFQ